MHRKLTTDGIEGVRDLFLKSARDLMLTPQGDRYKIGFGIGTSLDEIIHTNPAKEDATAFDAEAFFADSFFQDLSFVSFDAERLKEALNNHLSRYLDKVSSQDRSKAGHLEEDYIEGRLKSVLLFADGLKGSILFNDNPVNLEDPQAGFDDFLSRVQTQCKASDLSEPGYELP